MAKAARNSIAAVIRPGVIVMPGRTRARSAMFSVPRSAVKQSEADQEQDCPEQV